MKIDKLVTTKTTVTKKVNLDANAIRHLLEQVGEQVPANAIIGIKIPGGGDYSNMFLDIDGTMPVQVSWTEEEND